MQIIIALPHKAVYGKYTDIVIEVYTNTSNMQDRIGKLEGLVL